MILDFLRKAVGAARTVKDNVNARASMVDAYEGNAALPGVLLAYTGTTSAGADDLASAGIMRTLDGLHETVSHAALTCEHASQTAAGLAMELREIEAFLYRLKGGAPLKQVLEGET